jgi:heme/copper-type cytochrome/quinol oxidase subunit 3
MALAAHGAEHEHGLDLATRITRARVGALLLILSDAGFVTGMYASQSYLTLLNENHAFRPKGDNPPAILTGLILALVMVVSAAVYIWGFRQLRKGSTGQYRVGVLIAWVLAILAFIAQMVVLLSLNHPIPLDGFDSIVLITTAYHGVHLLITIIIGLLLLGRIGRGRIVGYEYLAEVSGYWWVYVAISALTTWAMVSFVK